VNCDTGVLFTVTSRSSASSGVPPFGVPTDDSGTGDRLIVTVSPRFPGIAVAGTSSVICPLFDVTVCGWSDSVNVASDAARVAVAVGVNVGAVVLVDDTVSVDVTVGVNVTVGVDVAVLGVVVTVGVSVIVGDMVTVLVDVAVSVAVGVGEVVAVEVDVGVAVEVLVGTVAVGVEVAAA